jgi:hypothetical protein
MENQKKMIESNIAVIKQASIDKENLIGDLRT